MKKTTMKKIASTTTDPKEVTYISSDKRAIIEVKKQFEEGPANRIYEIISDTIQFLYLVFYQFWSRQLKTIPRGQSGIADFGAIGGLTDVFYGKTAIDTIGVDANSRKLFEMMRKDNDER